jgi:hypothetical protein
MEYSNMWNIPFFQRSGKIGWTGCLFLLNLVISQASKGQATVLPLLRMSAGRECALQAALTRAWASSIDSSGAAWSIQTSVAPALFGLRGLSRWSMQTSYGADSRDISLEFRQTGAEVFREQTARIVWAEIVGPNVSLATAVTTERKSFSRYGAAWVAALDIGMGIAPFANVFISSAVNTAVGALGDKELAPPRQFGASAEWSATEFLTVAFDIEKEAGYPLENWLMTQIRPIDQMSFAVGLTENPRRVVLGINLDVSQVQCSYASSIHADLGWTHLFAIGIRWGGRP